MQRRQLQKIRARPPARGGVWAPPVVAATVRLIYCCWTKAAAISMATSAARPGSEAALKAPHSKSGHGLVPPLDDELEEKPPGTPPSPPVELDDEKGEPVDEASSSAD